MAVPVPVAQATVSLRSALAGTIVAGQRILIVGCPPGTFPHWLAHHSYAVLWPSSEAQRHDDTRVIPAEVGAVLMTRLLSHALATNVRHQAKERKLVCPSESFSPGGIMRLLEGIVEKPAKGSLEMTPTIRSVPAPAPAEEPLDDETAALVGQLNDAIAGLELLRDQVIAYGRQYAGVRGQLETLESLRRLLK